jgi:hypothetical protein
MKKLILTGALGATALLLSGCGDNQTDTVAEDTATVDTTTADTMGTTGMDTTASANWPAGTRIVEEGGTTYRVDPDGTRVAIQNNEWRIVTENGVRYRVGPGGNRVRIDDRGIDVDLGINDQGNLDLDVSTDGTDASGGRNN